MLMSNTTTSECIGVTGKSKYIFKLKHSNAVMALYNVFIMKHKRQNY